MTDLKMPAWMSDVVTEVPRIKAHQLSPFLPPADSTPRAASVLILFGEGPKGAEVLLLERAADMRAHPGQVAFPGGSQDETDADAVAAALREAQEETGLDPAGVHIVGVLPALWLPATDYLVTPVIGWWHTPVSVRAVDPAETASVHVIAVADLLDPANRGRVRHPSGYVGAAFLVGEVLVWGFTAAVLSRLFGLLGWEQEWDEERYIELPETVVAGSMRDLRAAVDVNALDVILVLCCLVYALTGYQQGFLIGSFATVGLVAGGFAGIQVAPWLLDGLSPSLGVSVAALAIVLVLSFLGQGLGALVGQQLRRRVTWQPARLVDALSGAALSVAAMLVIAWVLGVAASGARLDGINQEVRDSAVLGAVNQAMPGGSEQLLSTFNSVVSSSDFPRYLEPFEPERITSVPRPDSTLVRAAGVRRAGRSVVKIVGEARSCSETLEGSGFVYARHRVMTNAHVVAGVENPVVRLHDTDHAASVVYYNPDIDVAVLAVPDLEAPALRFTGPAASGRSAAVLGYPQDGPFDVQPGRVRSEQDLRSPDIYGNGSVVRDTYAIYALVRPGNSGGPLVTSQGRVLGIVFAASLVDDNTGYVLTAHQVAAAAIAGAGSTTRVGTGGCAL